MLKYKHTYSILSFHPENVSAMTLWHNANPFDNNYSLTFMTWQLTSCQSVPLWDVLNAHTALQDIRNRKMIRFCMTTALRQTCPCPGCHIPVFGQAILSMTPPLSNEQNWRLWELFKYFRAWIMYKIFIYFTPAWVSASEIASSERNYLLEVQVVQVGLVVLVAQAFPTGMFGFFLKKCQNICMKMCIGTCCLSLQDLYHHFAHKSWRTSAETSCFSP